MIVIFEYTAIFSSRDLIAWNTHSFRITLFHSDFHYARIFKADENTVCQQPLQTWHLKSVYTFLDFTEGEDRTFRPDILQRIFFLRQTNIPTCVRHIPQSQGDVSSPCILWPIELTRAMVLFGTFGGILRERIGVTLFWIHHRLHNHRV